MCACARELECAHVVRTHVIHTRARVCGGTCIPVRTCTCVHTCHTCVHLRMRVCIHGGVVCMSVPACCVCLRARGGGRPRECRLVEPNLTACRGSGTLRAVRWSLSAAGSAPLPSDVRHTNIRTPRVYGDRGSGPAPQAASAHLRSVRCPGSDAHTDMRSRLLSHKGLMCVVVVVAATPTYARRPAVGRPTPCPTHDRRMRALYGVCVRRIGNVYATRPFACGVFVHRRSAATSAYIAGHLTRIADPACVIPACDG